MIRIEGSSVVVELPEGTMIYRFPNEEMAMAYMEYMLRVAAAPWN